MPKFLVFSLSLLALSLAMPVDLMDRSSGLAGLACGGAGTARGGQISSAYCNPAALLLNTHSGLEFTYYQNMGLVNHTSLDGVILFDQDAPPLGLNYVQESINGIPKTSELGGQVKQDGTFSDEYSFLNFSSAVNISPGLSGGVNYKIISHSIAGYNASGYALDVGLLQMLSKELYLGLTFRNLLSALDWNTGTNEYLPKRLTGGIAYQFQLAKLTNYLFLDLDIFNENENNNEWNAGLESWIISDIFCLRGGINSREELSLGSGFKYYDFHCDLAVLFRPQEKQLDDTFMFGLGFDFNLYQNTAPVKSKEPADFQPKFNLKENILTISNLEPEKLLEIALLDKDYNIIPISLNETVSVPVSSGNYIVFFQLKDKQIIRKSVTIE